MGQRADELGRAPTREDFADEDLMDTPAQKGIDSLDVIEVSEGDGEIAATRVQIEHTRAELSETIDAIQERLDPQRLVEQAKEAARDVAMEKVEEAKNTVRQATIGKVEDAVNSVTDKVQDIMGTASDKTGGAMDAVSHTAQNAASAVGDAASSAGTTTRQASRSLLDTIRQHPLPATLAGIGLGWLYLSTRQDSTQYRSTYSSSYPYTPYADQQRGDGSSSPGQVVSKVQDSASQIASQTGERVSQAAGAVTESAGQVGTKVTSTAQRSAQGLGELVQRNPLAVGAVTIGLGMIAGLAVPETEKENQMLGSAHDAVMERAGQVTQETSQKVKSVAQEAMNAAKQEAQNQDLMPGS